MKKLFLLLVLFCIPACMTNQKKTTEEITLLDTSTTHSGNTIKLKEVVI